MLVKLFSSKLRVELLALFFTQPESNLYFGEIAKRTAEDRGNISRELRSLEGIGLLASRKEGNLKYYSLNKGFLLYDELGSMIRKTRGAAARLTEALTKVKGVEYAFLYGSLAAGTETAGSDIDLMVIGDIPLERLLRLLKAPEKALGRSINPSLYSLKEYKSRLKKKDPFVARVMEEPITMLIGDEGELRRSA